MMTDENYNCRQTTITVAKVSKEWKRDCALFEESLSDEQLAMFHKLCDLQIETTGDEMRAAYKAGFKDGMRLMQEVQE